MDVLVEKTRRFGPGYDLQHRFRTPSTFNYNARLFRPHTSDGNASSLKAKGQWQMEEIAQAQESSVAAFRRSLEESLMIIQHGQAEVDPSAFTNLNKIHILSLKQERASRQSSTRNSRQRLANRRPWTSDEGLHAARRSLWSAATRNETITAASSRRQRADALKKSFVEFISKSEKQDAGRPKTYQHHSEYLSSTGGPDDRCQRCSRYPQIRIDGRKIGGLSSDGWMARQHCDVLGMTMCPDCVRTRARNEHFRQCNASVSDKVLDVYKMALARHRIPTMISLDEIAPDRSIMKQRGQKFISVSSLDSTGKHVTKISIEATENPDSDVKVPEILIPVSVKVPQHDSNDSDLSSTDDNLPLEASRTTEPASDEAKSDKVESESLEPDLPADESKKYPSKGKKKSSKRKSKLFNKGLVPSYNYFTDMTDLQHRLRNHRKSRRIHFLEIEALAEEIQTRQQEDKAKIESRPDTSQSENSQDPTSPKTQTSPKIYEPPVLFGQRPSVLGMTIE